MSYNKNYGGQFMGIGSLGKGKSNSSKETKPTASKEKKNADKVIFAISELRSVNLPEINGDRYFICTVIFDNADVKKSMEMSNHNSSIVLGKYLHSAYSMTFDDEIVLKIPSNTSFARCYVSCVTVTKADNNRNIKLEGLGYTDPFAVNECKVYAYSSCKLNTAVGASDTDGVIKLCVKCVENNHPSTAKSAQPFNVLQEIKQRYDD